MNPLHVFVYNYFLTKYGLASVAKDKFLKFMESIKAN